MLCLAHTGNCAISQKDEKPETFDLYLPTFLGKCLKSYKQSLGNLCCSQISYRTPFHPLKKKTTPSSFSISLFISAMQYCHLVAKIFPSQNFKPDGISMTLFIYFFTNLNIAIIKKQNVD